MTVGAAYAICSGIAKREAKNFYYAFRVLPRPKREAMCAIYAFMRRADDIADDESLSIEERRGLMLAWTQAWKAAAKPSADRAGREHMQQQDPIFIAVKDAQQRFGISDELLMELVRGTSMDLEEVQTGVSTLHLNLAGSDTPTEFQVYETYDDLYRYCYLVASVVGLACIRIFGYTDPRAEKLAEKTGVAFQLTNILRDVREDAERGRVYLPLDATKQPSLMLRELAGSVQKTPAVSAMQTPTVKAVLEDYGARAAELYRAADKLIPMLDRDSRPAMWVMMTIYRDLLRRIDATGYDVFATRVRVPTAQKLRILAMGMMGYSGGRSS